MFATLNLSQLSAFAFLVFTFAAFAFLDFLAAPALPASPSFLEDAPFVPVLVLDFFLDLDFDLLVAGVILALRIMPSFFLDSMILSETASSPPNIPTLLCPAPFMMACLTFDLKSVSNLCLTSLLRALS